jgi:hypothetical protein
MNRRRKFEEKKKFLTQDEIYRISSACCDAEEKEKKKFEFSQMQVELFICCLSVIVMGALACIIF